MEQIDLATPGSGPTIESGEVEAHASFITLSCSFSSVQLQSETMAVRALLHVENTDKAWTPLNEFTMYTGDFV